MKVSLTTEYRVTNIQVVNFLNREKLVCVLKNGEI